MLLLYCSDPLAPRQPEDVYLRETDVTTSLGLPWHLIDHDALVRDSDPARAARRVPVQPQPVTAVYRGWMMSVEQYAALYQELASKNIRLLNGPSQYRHCHHLPESYSVIEGRTPRSVWVPSAGGLSIDRVMDVLRPFGQSPVVVKDYVKSQKHAWAEACFIPSAADRAAVERVVRRFLELQGDDLVGGLVFREFFEFEPLATHSQSGMPLTREYRLFFLDGHVLSATEYWEEGDYPGDPPPVAEFVELARRVQSRFFTVDVARTRGGDWLIVELGDGQVAGLPDRADVAAFYAALVSAMSGP